MLRFQRQFVLICFFFSTTLKVASASVFLLLGFSLPCMAKNGEALLYYANETVPDRLNTVNYTTLLDALKQSQMPRASEIRAALLDDIRESLISNKRDISALKAAAHMANIRLFVFTNELALRNEYMSISPLDGNEEIRRFDFVFIKSNELLRLSPLARPDVLTSALQTIASEIGTSEIVVGAIFKSHGALDMPLMPRVNVDVSDLSVDEVRRRLEGVAQNDLALPEVQLQGTTQPELWRVLETVGKTRSIRFPFVFLSSCDSGPVSIADLYAFPRNVGTVVHSQIHGMSANLIDYSSILVQRNFYLGGIGALSDALVKGLIASDQGLSSDTWITAFRWPLVYVTDGIPIWIFFIPLAVCITWQVFHRYRQFDLRRRLRINGGSVS